MGVDNTTMDVFMSKDATKATEKKLRMKLGMHIIVVAERFAY